MNDLAKPTAQKLRQQGYSYAAIAQKMKLPESSVRHLLKETDANRDAENDQK